MGDSGVPAPRSPTESSGPVHTPAAPSGAAALTLSAFVVASSAACCRTAYKP